jgi:hypothetical protein
VGHPPALGDAIIAAIRENTAKKQAKRDYDQWLQDRMSQTELACERNPEMGGAVGCRTFYFAVNSFIRKHQKDFFPCQENFDLIADAADKTLPADFALEQTTEQTVEMLFQSIDKKRLKKP